MLGKSEPGVRVIVSVADWPSALIAITPIWRLTRGRFGRHLVRGLEGDGAFRMRATSASAIPALTGKETLITSQHQLEDRLSSRCTSEIQIAKKQIVFDRKFFRRATRRLASSRRSQIFFFGPRAYGVD